MKIYKIGDLTFQYTEGMQPAGAVEVKDTPAAPEQEAEVEVKDAPAPATKARQPRTK